MATINEDYVSFETARLLKEKGFNERLITYYLATEDKKESYFQIMAFTDDKIDNNRSVYCYLAPTHQMTMKWLREVHNFYIWIGHIANKCLSWYYEIHGISDGKVKHIGGMQYGSYEIACEAAIKYCLENLI